MEKWGDGMTQPQPANDHTEPRSMPHNPEAEKGVLGAILLNNRVHEKVSDYLRPEHFAYERHGQIYEAIAKVIERGEVADGITLQRYFKHDIQLAEIGGTAYLGELTGSAASVINGGEYGRIVYDMYLRRQLIVVHENALEACYSSDTDQAAEYLIETVETELFSLAETGIRQGGLKPFSVYVDGALDDLSHTIQHGLQGVETHLSDIDKILTPLTPGLYILAGRPSMGKTALAWTISVSNAEKGKIVAFFSMEMPGQQIAQREFSARTGYSMRAIQRGEPTMEQFTSIRNIVLSAKGLPIHIDQTGGLYANQIRERARRLKRKKGLDLIVIDFLQLMQSRRKDGRVQEISEITRQLKQISLELAVPIIALSQLSRKCENRENKRPLLSDLRDSGSIEQDADGVLFVYREHYYLEKLKPVRRVDDEDVDYFSRLAKYEALLVSCENDCEVSIAKQRNGAVGTAELYFDCIKMVFGDKVKEGDTV